MILSKPHIDHSVLKFEVLLIMRALIMDTVPSVEGKDEASSQ